MLSQFVQVIGLNCGRIAKSRPKWTICEGAWRHSKAHKRDQRCTSETEEFKPRHLFSTSSLSSPALACSSVYLVRCTPEGYQR